MDFFFVMSYKSSPDLYFYATEHTALNSRVIANSSIYAQYTPSIEDTRGTELTPEGARATLGARIVRRFQLRTSPGGRRQLRREVSVLSGLGEGLPDPRRCLCCTDVLQKDLFNPSRPQRFSMFDLF